MNDGDNDGGTSVVARNRRVAVPRSGFARRVVEVTVFQKSVLRTMSRQPISPRRRCLLWTVTVLDVATVIWMIVYGPWLDSASALTSVATLGGNHLLVLVLALIGFLVLAVLAPFTEGFGSASRREEVLLGAAGLVSAVALAGLLSVLALVLVLVSLVALMTVGRLPAWVNVIRW
jgi:hypothetical protein